MITNINKQGVCVCKFVYGVRKLNNDSAVDIFMYSDAVFNSIGLKISHCFSKYCVCIWSFVICLK